MLRSFSSFLSLLLLAGLFDLAHYAHAAQDSTLATAVEAPCHNNTVHGVPRRRHHARLASAAAANSARDVDLSLEKRQGTNARFTYFVTGLGACGGWNVDSDFVVAINTPQWDNGNNCNKAVDITINGKTTQARIVDRCVECPYGALDFTIGLFRFFEPDYERAGTLYGSWNYAGQGPVQPPPSPDPTTTSSTWSWTSTSTSTTSTSATSTSTTSTSTTISSTVTSTSTSTSTTPTSTSTSQSTPTPTALTVLDQLNRAFVGFGQVVVRGPSSK